MFFVMLLQIHETVETINQLKTNRDFFLGFAKNPQEFINSWLVSQTRDLKVYFPLFISVNLMHLTREIFRC